VSDTMEPTPAVQLHTPTTQWTKSTCAYCGVGCGIEASVADNGDITVRGDASHPANFGKLCSKGLALGDTVTNEGRLLAPVINGETAHWSDAIETVASRFKDTIERHGPDSVAFYVSGQILTEDYYVANKLMKGYIGSGNIDTNSRLCMSSSVAGHKRAFGSDTVPNCYEDLELADLVVLTGSNMAWCHPVLYQRLKTAKANNPALKVVVIDPRATDTCELADLHLAINPGADVALFNGLLNFLNEHHHLNSDYIEKHTQGLDGAIATAQQDTGVNGVDYAQTAHLTGVPIAYIEQFFQWFANTPKVMTLYSQGVNQSSAGTDKVNSILNCHLATGRIGLPGAGPFSLTGQPNAMGGREVGGLANTLAAHMEFGNPEHHRLISEFWETDNLATAPGLKAVELFDAVASGKIKAIWIMATNPVVSMPNADKVRKALQDCPFVVVSDCIADTDTTRCADVLLPAMGWAEKSGTVTNSERRISRQRRLLASSENPQAKADWWIISQVALSMGYSGFNFTSDADVFREYAAMTGYHNNGSRDLDISGLATLSDAHYQQMAPQQWPIKPGDKVAGINHNAVDIDNKTHSHTAAPPSKRFFSEGGFYTPNRKATMVAVSHLTPQTAVSTAYPMVLNTGRIRDQWHTLTRTALATHLSAHKPEPYLQINPQDARCFQLAQGDIAEITSQWGYAKARVDISNDTNPGQVFVPMHWGQTYASHGRMCALVSPNRDPHSGQPEAKFTPVAIKKWHYHSEAIAITRTPLTALENLGYWVKRRITGGYLYYLANEDGQSLNDCLDQQLTLCKAGTTLSFNDPKSLQSRCAKIADGVLNSAYIIASKIDSSQYAWLDSLLDKTLDTDIQRALLRGTPSASMLTGRQICACKQVGELSIIDAIENSGCQSVAAIGTLTGAGTGCGSCTAEVAAILDKTLNAPVAAIAV